MCSRQKFAFILDNFANHNAGNVNLINKFNPPHILSYRVHPNLQIATSCLYLLDFSEILDH